MCVGVYIGPKHTLSVSVCTCMCVGGYVYVRRCVRVCAQVCMCVASYLICVTVSVCPMSRDVTQGRPSRKLLAAQGDDGQCPCLVPGYDDARGCGTGSVCVSVCTCTNRTGGMHFESHTSNHTI